jgi:hypothetical protein
MSTSKRVCREIIQLHINQLTAKFMSIFEDKSPEVVKEIAIILAKVSHNVHPLIVEKIVDANKKYKEQFKKICHHALDVETFFYEGSDCIFPGTRRSINNEKDGTWKNKINEKDGTILNDNTYPRHLWAHLCSGNAYSGGAKGNWSHDGLNAFELAHVFAHKISEQETELPLFEYDDRKVPYALFSSASNTVLIPNGLTKPTDKSISIKIIFYMRLLDLYKGIVKIPGVKSLKKEFIPEWHNEVHQHWIKPILPENWEKNVDKLLEYREKYLKNKYMDCQK